MNMVMVSQISTICDRGLLERGCRVFTVSGRKMGARIRCDLRLPLEQTAFLPIPFQPGQNYTMVAEKGAT